MMKKRLSGLLSLILLPLVIQTARAETAPQTVNIGYQKGNIFALLKFRGSLDKDFKQQGINVNWIGFTAGPQMLEGLNVGSIDLAATGDAPRWSPRRPGHRWFIWHTPRLIRCQKPLWCRKILPLKRSPI